MKQQVVFIHGGETWNSYELYINFLCSYPVDLYEKKPERWKDTLSGVLGEDYEVISPEMPSKMNAKYSEWKIWFEKFVPFFRDGVIFVGHSLGGIFLAKYFSENMFPRKVRAVYLLAAPFWTSGTSEEAADFILPGSMETFSNRVENIFIYHSDDDPVVVFSHAREYQRVLSKAALISFQDRGHFLTEEFPELVSSIQKLS